MRVSVGLVALLLAAAAFAQEPAPSDDDPKSTITEWPPKKPAPKPPANPPPSNSQNPPTQTQTTAPKPNSNAQSAPAQNGQNAQPQNAQPQNGQPQNAQPPKTQTQVVAPPPPKPQHQPAPLVGQPFKEITVPAGQNINDVKVAGAENQSGAGLGDRIVEIKIVDNTKTDTVTVEYLSGAHIGDTLTTEYVDKVRTNLQSADLFKDVLVYWEPNVQTKDGSGVRLVISAKDKLSWIVAPLFFYSDRNIGGGLAYANANVLGHNKKFLAVAQYATSQKMIFLAFLDPQIHDSRFYYRVDFLLRRDNIVEYNDRQSNPQLERATDVDTVGAAGLLGVNFTRKFHLDLRLKFYYDRVNPSECFNTTNFDGSGTPDVVARQGGYCRQPSSSGWDNTLTATIGYDGRAKVMGVQSGLSLNAQWQYGASWLGTRWDYHLISGNALYAWRFFKQHNLIIKGGFEVDLDPPFKQEVETGGPAMRGYLFRQFRGDTSVRATIEYYLPLFTVYGLSLRAVGFYDSNLTWFRSLPAQNGPLDRFVVHGNGFRDFLPDTPSGVTRDSWHNGVGGGLRMYLTGVVLPLIGVDFAYGLESNSFQWYVALGGALD